MLCDKCGKKIATTHIRSIVNGAVYESHICSECALNKALPNGIDRCPCCGTTLTEILKNSRCGCSECYTRFYVQLLPLFKRIHGSTEYIGKKINSDDKNGFKSIDELNVILKKLIAEENYEQAAVIRDEIKKLKEGAV